MTWNFLPTEERETTTLIQLNDDRVTRIEIDSSYRPSTCDTCDYGKAYIQNLILTLRKMELQNTNLKTQKIMRLTKLE